MKIYKAFEEAKNGTKIPVFLSGRSMESRYNPQRDAENLCNNIEANLQFFLVLGIGSGIFIELLSQKYPAAKIIGLELYKEDIDFLKESETIKKLCKNPLITFTPLEKLEETLEQNYLPARYGNLKIIEQRGWINEIQDKIESINSILRKSLGIISADYSVQAHFGKIWTSNILNNSLLAEKHSLSFFEDRENILKKTAVIVAAGPSLDKTISILSDKNSRSEYFIFSTDTAGQALIKQGIIPEVIVSIDGQAVSYNHFMKEEEFHKAEIKSAPLFAFDLCSNFSAAKYIFESGNKVMFFSSGHPLSRAINVSNGNILNNIFSGAGTVTISALDLALLSGFTKLLILGADFSYFNGKAYTAGTYLDTLYNQSSSKLLKAEQSFSKLMFRTELKSITENIKTTEILEAYRLSLEKYLQEKNISFTNENDIYVLECKSSFNNSINQGMGIFKKSASFSLKPFIKKVLESSSEEIEPLLLPYIAWLRNNDKYKNLTYNELLNLALQSIVSYNI